MALIKFLTDKGTVSVKARGEIKNQTAKMLVERIPNAFISEKGVAIEIGTDQRSGESIYVVIDPTVTMTLEPKAKTSKSKAKADVDPIPNIFE